MKVTKYGRVRPKKLTCRDCEAVLEYTQADVKHTRTPGQVYDYIVCPVCGQVNRIQKEDK